MGGIQKSLVIRQDIIIENITIPKNIVITAKMKFEQRKEKTQIVFKQNKKTQRYTVSQQYQNIINILLPLQKSPYLKK